MVLGAEFCAAQAKVTAFTLQCDGACLHVSPIIKDCNAAAGREVTVSGNLRSAEVVRDVLYRNVTAERCGTNWMKEVLINLRSEANDLFRCLQLVLLHDSVCLRQPAWPI